MIVPSMNCDIICAMFRRKKSVNKKLLEHKLYLARENPEPIFDLADCDLTDVPMGIYSLCKVFLKQSLILTNNQITSLSGGGDLKDLNKLRILNISFNDFHSLPEEISIFEQLEELYVDNNHLKSLPDSLCHLVNLKILSCTNNKLKSLPEGIGLLIKLEELNLRVNPQLSRLPKSICKAASLALLSVDSENFIYPPKDVIESGTEALLKFISEDVGFDYSPPVRDTEECTRTSPAEADQVQEAIVLLERKKLKRVQDFLDFERNNKLIQEKEIEIANVHKENKKKLLESISQRQSNLDLELSKLHQVRELERFRLIEQLQEAENNADIAINNLLNLSKEPVSQLLEKEKEEETKLISALKRYNDKLKKDDILVAMENILKQEAEVFNKFHRDKTDSSRNIIEQEQETNTKLFHLFQQQDTQRANLIGKLMENNDLQKAAMGALLERGDARSWGLVQQVRLVESQLSVLTSIEIDRRKLEIDERLNDLCEKRMNLSILLMELLEQQRIRRNQLLSTLQNLEDCSTNSEDFWLKQYQCLLEKLPEGLAETQRNIDPKLAEILLAKGVLQCIPFLAKLTQNKANPKDITEMNLIEAGVTDPSNRQDILDALQIYSKEQISYDFIPPPSAPELEHEASAPPSSDIKFISAVDCVVCMDIQCDIIFVPCGHLCCCSGCSEAVNTCPLCRSEIQRKVFVINQ